MFLVGKSSLFLLSYFLFCNALYASQTNKYRSTDQLEASCTIILLHLSFLLEYDMLKTQTKEFPLQLSRARDRARISQEVFTRSNIFTKYLKSQPIVPSVAGRKIRRKLTETFNSHKHRRMWKDLKLKTENSTVDCKIKEEGLAWKVSEALFEKNYRLALNLLFAQTRLEPSTQILYEWIQKLYARSHRSPGKVTLEHLK